LAYIAIEKELSGIHIWKQIYCLSLHTQKLDRGRELRILAC
jgi:hypothetical protein